MTSMRRRSFLKTAATVALAPIGLAAKKPEKPDVFDWDFLRMAVGGRLEPIDSPVGSPEFLANLKNPFYVGDQPALTQTSGWIDAWMSKPSAYVLSAETAADVAAGVRFARSQNVRLAVRGGGHSYKGTSNAADSLLIWTRKMREVQRTDWFVPAGAPRSYLGQPAVTLGAGCIWMDAYDAVTTKAGLYVQGGGCTTVGVAGLVQAGGFGSFSKQYGPAAGALLEAEVVTAEGSILVANHCQNTELFWALKGGGGGSFGIITKLTLRTHELPEFFGGVFGRIKAATSAAYERLVAQAIRFYAERLFNPHWGEQLKFHPDHSLEISMVFQGLNEARAREIWSPFVAWINDRKSEYQWLRDFGAVQVPALHFWDAEWWRKNIPRAIVADSRADANPRDFFWEGDQGQVSFFLHGFQSSWLPQRLLTPERQSSFVRALVAASAIWTVALHFNKGLAGGSPEAIKAALQTALNPKVTDAFALAIIAGGGSPAYAAGEPDLDKARRERARINRAAKILFSAAGGSGAYSAQSDYFQRNWRESFWGANVKRLARVKKKCDPTGLFTVHHGIA